MSDITTRLVDGVQSAYESDTALEIIGGGSKRFMGRDGGGEPLHLSEHTGIVTYHPTELVMTARSGTTIDEINKTLAENGQACQFESPAFEGRATLGGTLACNLSGPARPWQGSIRDAVLGVRLINGKGELLKFGGQVMKNVAGYDVSRLQAGAMGTLGVITEVSFKVMPIQTAMTTLVLEMGAADAVQRMNQLAGQPVPLSAAAWCGGKLYLRLEGASLAVTAATEKLGGEVLESGRSFWQELGEQQHEFFQGDAPLWRFSVNSSAPVAPLDTDWLIDWGGAQRWIRGEFDRPRLENFAEEAKGHLGLYRHGDRGGEVFHTASGIQQRIHKNLKASFDPKGVLNPGRLYGWL